ncbi:hypothetical protein HU200_025387 [Digitaria exilis]|uniref:F-box domain-containing protein n=1 Tax=Digitaria exilis TaxID=1010633 RepID=A0A835C5C1_9POAL|nr:hypothetical protein HU200_025387 [Digitaria exilis]
MDSAGDLDRISALPDALLGHILAFVRDAAAVTRTSALSRRRRGVWVHAPRLSLWDTTVPGDFTGFVGWALAHRGDADIGSLDIGMYRPNCRPASTTGSATPCAASSSISPSR